MVEKWNIGKDDELAKSPETGLCEERSDEAIS